MQSPRKANNGIKLRRSESPSPIRKRGQSRKRRSDAGNEQINSSHRQTDSLVPKTNAATKEKRQSKPAKQPVKEINRIVYIHDQRPARVYKRWVIMSSIVTLIVAWIIFPRMVDRSLIPAQIDFGNFSEIVFESALFRMFPTPPKNLFGGMSEDFFGNLTSIIRPWWKSETLNQRSPGSILKQSGAVANFPVLMIPGVTSVGLELWEGEACAQKYFRQRLWGTLTMLRVMLTDRECWLQHLRLHHKTWLDPPGIRLRAAQGLEAADFVLPGFWVWGQVIENLAELGYDHKNLQMASYDWRLDQHSLEERDGYFTHLQTQIETLKKTNGGKRVVILCHSAGSNTLFYFFKWIEHTIAKKATKAEAENWVENHVEAFVNIGGAFLGVPKSISVPLSGEMRDTAQLGPLESYLLEMVLSQKERAALFRSWFGGFTLAPKGGNWIWGNSTYSADLSLATYYSKISLDKDELNDDSISNNLVAAAENPLNRASEDTKYKIPYGLLNLLEQVSEKSQSDSQEPAPAQHPSFQSIYYSEDVPKLMKFCFDNGSLQKYEEKFSTGIAKISEIAENDHIPRKWLNPLEARLPKAPTMRIYCFYGVGRRTERAYRYKQTPKAEVLAEASKILGREATLADLPELFVSIDPRKLILPLHIDTEVNDPKVGIENGVYMVDGDGTVPLISLGYMCSHAWPTMEHLNPAQSPVITKEYLDEPIVAMAKVRGGPKSGDHVDILGNHEMINDILKIACNFSDAPDDSPDTPSTPIVKERIHSKIREISRNIHLPIYS